MRVIGVGDNVVDKYVDSGIMYPGGNALNFAVYAAQAGVESAYQGTRFGDAAGPPLYRLEPSGNWESTALRCRVVPGRNGSSLIRLADGNSSITEENELLKDFPLKLDEDDLRYISDFAPRPHEHLLGIEDKRSDMRRRGTRVSYDFSDLWDEARLRSVCPLVDFSVFSCGAMSDAEAEALLRRVVTYGSPLALGTLGRRGAMVFDGHRLFVKAPYRAVGTVLDTLGAGDAYLTGFLLSYVRALDEAGVASANWPPRPRRISTAARWNGHGRGQRTGGPGVPRPGSLRPRDSDRIGRPRDGPVWRETTDEHGRQTILSMREIHKCYGGIRALNAVNLELNRGEVLCLLGENGAGKSTLMKILSGAERPDRGEILIEGEPVAIHNPKRAHELGISTVYQELIQIPDMSISENIFTGRYPLKLGLIDKNSLIARTVALMRELGVQFDPETRVRRLSIAQRQLVEIMKAVSYDSRIIVFDEPTSSLTQDETEMLFRIIGYLKGKGTSIIYISHRLEETFRIGDRVLVLRDG
jgi:ABC-type branched-subunit amino acid transport system ATPase component/sugar/nucleoside kinase (ribokinase family)